MKKLSALFVLISFVFCFIFSDFLIAQTSVKRVAVLYFMDYSTDYKYGRLVEGLPDLLSQELGSYPEITIVERMQINEVLREMELSRSAEFDPSTAAKIGKLLGVQTIILGGLYEVVGKIKLSARLIQVETGKIEKGFSSEGEERELFNMVKGLASEIRYTWSGSIYANSYPQGARIYINGNYEGGTPKFFGGLKGDYSVRIVKSGYELYSSSVYIYPGKKQIINAHLSKTEATIRAEREAEERMKRGKHEKEMEKYKKEMRSYRKDLGLNAAFLIGGYFLATPSSKEENGEESDAGTDVLKILGWTGIVLGSIGLLGTLGNKPEKPNKYISIKIIPIKDGVCLNLNYRF